MSVKKFKINQVNKDCFKLYLYGHFIGALHSRKQAEGREKAIADAITKEVDQMVRERTDDRLAKRLFRPVCPVCGSTRVTVHFGAWEGEGCSARCREDACLWSTKELSGWEQLANPPAR